VLELRVMTAQIEESLLRDRLMAVLAGAFGVLAAVLAAIGLYGVIAYMAARRQNEIGVRMALGAERGTVYRLVLSEAAQLIVVGTVVGIAGSVGAATLMRKLLFGVQAWDASTLAAVAIVLASSALLASYLPARRAASVSPADALRSE
jgi:ABC-type antimicrobial peptide transport system permease subunit